MTRRTPNRPQRLLSPAQVRELRSYRAEAERLLEARREALTAIRAINRRLPELGYRALGRRYGISHRTVEAIATFVHYKEIR